MKNDIKIGDKFNTSGYGEVLIIDALMSPTTGRCIFEIKPIDEDDNLITYLIYVEELD